APSPGAFAPWPSSTPARPPSSAPPTASRPPSEDLRLVATAPASRPMRRRSRLVTPPCVDRSARKLLDDTARAEIGKRTWAEAEVFRVNVGVVVSDRAPGNLEPRGRAGHPPRRHRQRQGSVYRVGDAAEAPTLPPVALG